MKSITDINVDKISVKQKCMIGYSYSEGEKHLVLRYLKSFDPCWFTTAPVEDPFTKEQVGKTDLGYSDGVYTWYESEIYCLEKYNLALTEEFRKYVREKAGK